MEPAGVTSDQLVLDIRDLSVRFRTPTGTLPATDSVGYQVRPGETLGVVGETGSGKSVTVLAALGLLPEDAAEVSGQAFLRNVDLRSLDETERRRMLGRDIAMVFQDPGSALNPVQRIGDQLAEALLVHDGTLTRAAAYARVLELLESVGVPEPALRARQYPHQLSGGMCQRVVIAMALANRPAVLVADEPTTALDVSVQAQILELLRVAASRTGAATVLITHNLGVVAEVADRVCVMYAGRVVENGPVHEVFANPRHPYTAALLRAQPRLDDTRGRLVPIPGQPPDPTRTDAGCAFAPRCPVGRDRTECATRPELLAVPAADPAGTASDSRPHLSACHFPEKASPEEASPEEAGSFLDQSAEPVAPEDAADGDGSDAEAQEESVVLVADDVHKRFPIRTGILARRTGWIHAVEGISARLTAGRTLALVGESGCGKSTFARMLLRLIDASEGSITVDGTDLAKAGRGRLRELRQQVQMVYQDPYASLDPHLTVGDNVAEPLRIAGRLSRAERRQRVLELFERVGLRPEHVNRFPAQFSGGQRQRVAIARALAPRPRLLVLDEPVSALDVSVQAQVLNLLSDLQRTDGMAYLFVSHDLSVVRQVADEVAVMYLGRVVESGSVDRIYRRPRHPYTRALLASVPVPDPAGREHRRRVPLTGDLPSPADPPSGCRFRTRCPLAEARCAEQEPALRPLDGGWSACHFAERLRAAEQVVS